MLHPDTTYGSHEKFIRLQEAYAKALGLIEADNENKKETGMKTTRSTGIGLRENVLSNLYRYALKFNGVEAEQVFLILLKQLKDYRPATYQDLLRYQNLFRNTYAMWRNDANIYDAHNLWIAGIVELANYLSCGWPRYRTIFEAYLAELKTRVNLLEEGQKGILMSLADWLMQEVEGEFVQVIYE